MRKRFVASTGPNNSIKLFEAETGQLFRQIHVGETISSTPICTEQEVFVTVTKPSGNQEIRYFGLPNGNLLRAASV
jgi:hypothetical protein